MGAAILFPKFLRKLQCIWWPHQKQNGCQMPPIQYVQASTVTQFILEGYIISSLGEER